MLKKRHMFFAHPERPKFANPGVSCSDVETSICTEKNERWIGVIFVSVKERGSWEALGAPADAHRSLLFVVVFLSREVLVRGVGGGHGEGKEGGELGGCSAHGEVEGDSLVHRVSRDRRCREQGGPYLLFADSAVLVAAIAHHMAVATGIPAQAGFAGPVEQGEFGYGNDPEQHADAAGDDAVDGCGAGGPAEVAPERQGNDGDGGDEAGDGHGEEDEGGREVGAGGPRHGQLILAQVDVAVAAEDLEGVNEEDDDGAAEHNDQQAEGRAQSVEPVRMPAGELERHWHARGEAGSSWGRLGRRLAAGDVLGHGVQWVVQLRPYGAVEDRVGVGGHGGWVAVVGGSQGSSSRDRNVRPGHRRFIPYGY